MKFNFDLSHCLISAFLVSLILFFSNGAFATTASDVKQKTKEAAAAAAEYTKEQKEQIQNEMESTLNSLKAKISELKLSADTQAGAARQKAKAETAKLEKEQIALDKKLSKFKKSSGKAWDDMKTGFSEALERLSSAYDKAKENYK